MKAIITTINTGSELYIYCNGKLIYKRWINQNYSRIFHEGEGIREFNEKYNINVQNKNTNR